MGNVNSCFLDLDVFSATTVLTGVPGALGDWGGLGEWCGLGDWGGLGDKVALGEYDASGVEREGE